MAIVATGRIRWGKRAITFKDLVAEAGKATFDNNPNIRPSDIKSFIISAEYPERSAFHGHPAPPAAKWCGVRKVVPASRERVLFFFQLKSKDRG